MMDTRSQEMTNDNRSPLSDIVQSSADTADKEVNGSENVFNGQANCDTSEAEAETEAGLEPGSPPTSASDSVFSSEANGKKIFDAQRMPARSILKRKGKFSTGDSGCDLTEASRRNSANLTTKSNPADQPEIDSAIDSPDGSHINAANVTTDGNSLNHGAFNFVVDDSATVMTSETATYDITVVPRRRGILKNRSKEEADKRLSTCSGGSNSSADILDFSYDSCDDLLSLKYYRQPSPMLLSDNEEMRDVSTTEAESGIHPDFFSLEAQKVYKQALDICKNF